MANYGVWKKNLYLVAKNAGIDYDAGSIYLQAGAAKGVPGGIGYRPPGKIRPVSELSMAWSNDITDVPTLSVSNIILGTNAAVGTWPTSGSGISAAEAGQIATNVASGVAHLPYYDPGDSNRYVVIGVGRGLPYFGKLVFSCPVPLWSNQFYSIHSNFYSGPVGDGVTPDFDKRTAILWNNNAGTNIWRGLIGENESSRIAHLGTNTLHTVGGLTTTGTVSAGSFAFGDGDAITNWPRGDVLGATINPPHTVATNDGILAFTIGATGSGFPLTNDVSAAGFDIESIDAIVGNSLMLTNDASVRDMTVRGDLEVVGAAEYVGDVVINGNITLIGAATNLNWITVDNRTNVYGGTNYYETTVYATNVAYQKTIVYTNIVTTNNVKTYVTQNGQWNATNAEYAWFPHLRDYRDGNAIATGTWDFAGATVAGLGFTNEMASAFRVARPAVIEGTTVTIWPATNWLWSLATGTGAVSSWTIPIDTRATNQAAVVGLEIFRAESNSWAWMSGLTNAPPEVGKTNLFLLHLPVGGTNWTIY
jgi:hypothetical protein